MKGTLTNPLTGVPPVGVYTTQRLDVTPQEWAFWMWRVSGISISFTGNIGGSAKHPPDNHVHSGSASASRTILAYNFSPTGLLHTEKNQALTRRAFSTTADPGLGYVHAAESEGTFTSGDSQSWVLTVLFCGNGGYDDAGWWIGLDVAGSMVFLDFHDEGAGVFNSTGAGIAFGNESPGSPSYAGSGVIHIEADDPVLEDGFGNPYHYERDVSFLFAGDAYTGAPYPDPGSQGLTSANINVSITPIAFHDWRDRGGVPTYDSATGQFIYPT